MGKSKTFAKVETTDYYGEWEEAKPYKLVHGQIILVKWPDNKTTTETLAIVWGSGSAQVDMNGIPDTFATQHLFIHKTIHGLRIKIPLTGLYVKGCLVV